LDVEQIATLLNENSECIVGEYEKTENVLNIIELANLGVCSIFNGTLTKLYFYKFTIRN